MYEAYRGWFPPCPRSTPGTPAKTPTTLCPKTARWDRRKPTLPCSRLLSVSVGSIQSVLISALSTPALVHLLQAVTEGDRGKPERKGRTSLRPTKGGLETCPLLSLSFPLTGRPGGLLLHILSPHTWGTDLNTLCPFGAVLETTSSGCCGKQSTGPLRHLDGVILPHVLGDFAGPLWGSERPPRVYSLVTESSVVGRSSKKSVDARENAFTNGIKTARPHLSLDLRVPRCSRKSL
jgi:hypothetical protein